MNEQTQKYLEYANEAASKIREIYHIFGGYGDESSPEDGLLGKVYDCVAEMISLYLAPITGKEVLLRNIVIQIYKADCVGCLEYSSPFNIEEMENFCFLNFTVRIVRNKGKCYNIDVIIETIINTWNNIDRLCEILECTKRRITG